MPPRSKILQLPDDVRQELEQKLIGSGFADYTGLSEWLAGKGYGVSKSALHRFGQSFEDRCNALSMATQQAKAIVEATPDDEGAMTEALMRLLQEKLFAILLEMEVDPAKVNIGAVAKAMAPIARASIALKKHRQEIKERADAAARALDSIARKTGMTEDAAQEIRDLILGIGSGSA